MDKCSICGGTILINADSATGTCDSCGNCTDIDTEAAEKYRGMLALADRKMMLNSVRGFSEAIDILNDITFVDGTEERICTCNRKISELKEKEISRQSAAEKNEAGESRIGAAIVIIMIIAFLVIAAAVVFVIYKLLKGELTQQQMYIVIGIVAVSVIMFIAGKLKS